MKQLLILVLGFSLVFFQACKNEPTAENTGTETPATEQEMPKVDGGTSISSMGNMGAVTLVPDPKSSVVTWTGTKPIGGSHTGTIRITGGEFYVIRGFMKQGNFTIDMNSINADGMEASDKAKLEGHLKSPDFFDTNQFPNATFSIQRVETAENDPSGATHKITGNLTIRDVTKSITFPANLQTTEDKVIVNTPEFTINRTVWGIKYKSGLIGAAKDEMISDEIKLKVHVEAPVTKG